MQLSTKLTLCLSITSTLILGSYGVWQLRQEERDLRATAEHQLWLLGTAVQVAVEHSVRDQQTTEVRDILEALEFRDSTVDVLVFDPDGQLQANSWGSGASAPIVRAAVRAVNASQQATTYFDGPDTLQRLVGIFPLRADNGGRLGAVAVVWPLDELRRDLNATARAAVVSSLVVIVGITGVGWLLALVFVRRPLRALTEAMKAVESGDWVASVTARGDDEVGAALTEFNAMVRELGATRQELIHAGDARETLEREVRRLDKLATVGQLSAGLAHEIGSPLQVLNGRARAIAARTDLPPDVIRSAGVLDEQSERIARIVDQLLHVTRRGRPQMAPVDFRRAVGAIVDLMEAEAKRRPVHLQFECAEPLPHVIADPDQVQQVTMNLVTNALRATPPGGRVAVSVEAARFAPAGSAVAVPAVCLAVEDTGAGIPAEKRQRIFDAFFTTWREHGGTGLGLAIVKAIVDEHGGAITVSPRSGGGTRIAVYFPAVAALAAGDRRLS